MIRQFRVMLTVLSVIFGIFTSVAEEYPVTVIRATYKYTYLATTPSSGKEYAREDDYMLQIAPAESRFCSIATYDYEKLMTTEEGKALIKEMFRIATVYDSNGNKTIDMSRAKDIRPKRGSNLVVYKSHATGEIEVRDHLAFQDYIYSVPMADLVWEPVDSVKTVLRYDCQMAVADYHGRRWKAWFAPEIPVQEGPWQLCGLPGLIMEAQSDGGEYKFVITGVEKTEEQILPMPKKRDFIKTDRISFLKEKHELLEDPAKIVGGNVRNADGTLMGKVKLLHDLIETDYR